jgi:signal transduction histidine kinase
MQFAICLSALLLSILFCSILAYTVSVNNQHEIQKIEEKNKGFSHSLREYLTAAFQLTDHNLKQGRYEWVLNHQVKDHREFYKNFPNFKTMIIQIAVIDSSGMLRATSIESNPSPIYLGDRDHFKAHVRSTTDSLFVSPPVIGRVSKKKTIQLSRPIFRKDGNFDGVIVASLDANMLESFVNTKNQKSVNFGVLGLDGSTRLWYGDENFDLSQIDLQQEKNQFSGKLHGLFNTVQKKTNSKLSWYAEPLYDFPLYVVSGGENSKQLNELNTQTVLTVVLALIFVLTTTAFAIYLVRALHLSKKVLRKLQVSQIKANSANLMKSRFVASISHDLRTPLNGILGFSELIAISKNLEQANSFGSIVHASAKHLRELVNTILDIAKIEAGKMEINYEITDLHQLCDSVAEIHRYSAKNKGLILSVDYDNNLPSSIYIDPTKLMQILNNLLHNAVKFTVQGCIFFHVAKKENKWLFRVADSGIGMSQADIEHIFDRFQCSEMEDLRATSEHGSGLGMALCKELTELLGGKLYVFSTLNVGTVAEIWIPINAKDEDNVPS